MSGNPHSVSLGAFFPRDRQRPWTQLPRRLAVTAGVTLLELVVACAILMVLAGAAMPLARAKMRSYREEQLRDRLKEMRDAIDRYKDASDKGQIQSPTGTEGYPPDLQTLVDGVDLTVAGAGPGSGLPNSNTTGATQPIGTASGTQSSGKETVTPHIRFLRKIEKDPFTGDKDWGLRSVQDDPDSTDWGGQDVFDVYSKSTDTALDGTKYSDW